MNCLEWLQVIFFGYFAYNVIRFSNFLSLVYSNFENK
jgi:hypothetical protein